MEKYNDLLKELKQLVMENGGVNGCARKLGTHGSTLSNLLNGRGRLSVPIAQKLDKKFKTELGYDLLVAQLTEEYKTK